MKDNQRNTTTRIITHRGLDPDRPRYFKESSLEAFTDQLARGYGLEFDMRVTADGQMTAIHDSSLERLTGGRDKRKINEVPLARLVATDFDGQHLTSIPHLLELIAEKGAPRSISALHLKSANQTPEGLEILAGTLEEFSAWDKLIVFDATIPSAKYLVDKVPGIRLAASVSHPYDIERFNNAAGGTLITMEQLLENKDLFSWAWLDEWDRKDKNDGEKTLLNTEIFGKLRDHGIGIALVTPELHTTSPSQPTGVQPDHLHEDGSPRERLNARLAEIVALKPGAMCTDHPDFVRRLIEDKNN